MSLRVIAQAAGLVALMVASAVAQTGQLEVKDVWARATPARAENGAAYLTVVSPIADRLVAVSTPVAKKAELHSMSLEAGIMKMRPLAAIELPAGKGVTLKPGALHIMLIDLAKPLSEGQNFPLTLTFEKAGAREVTATVQKIGAVGPHGPSGHPMPMHNH